MMTSTLDYMRQQLSQLSSLFQLKFSNIANCQNAYDILYEIPGSNGFLNYVEYSPRKLSLEKANLYFKQFPQAQLGLCTGVWKNGKVLRHFDWYYNDETEFVVKMNKDPTKGVLHSSIGIAAICPMLTRPVMSNIITYGMQHEYFDILPYTMIDGINDSGLYVQSNAEYVSDVSSINVNPDKATEACEQTMLVRMLLDKAGSIDEVQDVLDDIHIYGTSKIKNINLHFLVADSNHSYVIEFENDHYEMNELPIVTNFRTNRGFTWDEHFMPDWSTIEPCGGGVERWEVAARSLSSDNDLTSLRAQLMYTNGYVDIEESASHEAWMTDHCVSTDITVQDVHDCHINKESSQHYAKCIRKLEMQQMMYRNRNRISFPSTWHTVHSAIYDINNLSCQVKIQEDDMMQYDIRLD